MLMLWQPRSRERAHDDGSDMDFELLSPVILSMPVMIMAMMMVMSFYDSDFFRYRQSPEDSSKTGFKSLQPRCMQLPALRRYCETAAGLRFFRVFSFRA